MYWSESLLGLRYVIISARTIILELGYLVQLFLSLLDSI